ncbi:Coenzyme A disulfide reductase [Candidatus Lokiarchaeum ossiferum]|uniref:Coenzyme A disulfide reductase n=1 Tax=Candidatus Lokiarchaeum ossiferum TaxID=2951803 RepID=A0ABY6HSD1_9ARCH|nr:Coenzyme A disulfide reductase [Candidatus Lokiarchaeum sp. B-35]
MSIKNVVIVGGVAGGASTAARLRRLSEDVNIIMLERGPYVSFANCGLPYYVGNVIKERDALELMTPELFNERFNFDVRVKHEVISINREEKTVTVKKLENDDEYVLSYDVLVLSPGAKPIVPPIPGLNEVPHFVIRDIPDVEKITKFIEYNKVNHSTVIGGGYIGIEIAENLRERGFDVEIVEMAPQILMPFDFEMAQIAHQEMGFNGVKLHLNERAVGFTKPGEKTIVKLESGDSIETDLLIMAVGVMPDTSLARNAGLDLSARGHIVVDHTMHTSDPNIFAVGDAIQVHNMVLDEPWAVPLAGIANRQGRVAADNIAGVETHCEGVLGTSVLKIFGMIAAATGMNERTLKTKSISYEKIYAHPNNHAGYYPGASSISLKLLFEIPTGRILGVQAIGGSGTEKRIDVIATAMKFGGTVFDLERLELSYAPPFGSAKDPVNMLGFIGSNILRRTMKIWHWHDVDQIREQGGVFLDVRTKEEFDIAHFEGALNISDLELRKKIDLIPRDKPIYINCQVGFRGYLAYRTLIQLGFSEVYNLTGGYKTFEYAQMRPEEFAPMAVDPRVKILEQRLGRPGDDISGQKELKVVNACGLSCPGPLNSMIVGLKDLPEEQFLQVQATDPSFASTIKTYVELNDGIDLISLKKKGDILLATVFKKKAYVDATPTISESEETKKKDKSIRPVGLPILSEITAEDLYAELHSDNPPPIIIDTREKSEWNQGHLKEATLIPLGKLQGEMKKLEQYKQQEIITICHSGSRSYMAGRLLQRAGFEYIRSVQGGMIAWVRAGYKYV